MITDCKQLVSPRYSNEPCTVCRKGVTDKGRPCTCCNATGRHRDPSFRHQRENPYAEFASKEHMWKR